MGFSFVLMCSKSRADAKKRDHGWEGVGYCGRVSETDKRSCDQPSTSSATASLVVMI